MIRNLLFRENLKRKEVKRMKRVVVFVCAVILISFASHANALMLDSVSGSWNNVVGGSNINFVTVGNENQVRWGVSTGSGQSGLGFEGIAPPSLSLALETAFDIGTLRHFNNPIVSGTAASLADLTISLNFSDPTIASSPLFTFQIDETPNARPCAYPSTTPCADQISFPSALASETFDISGTLYTLELLGFRVGSSFVSDFISNEGGTNSAILIGKITADIASVPEPGTLLLLGSGLVGLAFARRKLNK